jgi:hypothetical protein
MKKVSISALSALLLATLACSIFVGGPSYPEGPAPVATETDQTLQQQVEQALAEGATTGTVSLHLSEGQLTSYLAGRLAQESKPVISDPRVYLRNGEMKIFGKATSGIFVANVSITVQATVDTEGKPQISVTQTDFGPIAAPKALNEAVTTFVQEAFTGWLGPVATGFRLEHIDIGDGVMTVTGRIK